MTLWRPTYRFVVFSAHAKALGPEQPAAIFYTPDEGKVVPEANH